MLSAISVLAAEDENGNWLPARPQRGHLGHLAFLIVVGLLWWKAGRRS